MRRMVSATFDTLQAARDLEKAGVAKAHAEAIAEAIRSGNGELATRSDIDGLRTSISALFWVTGVHVAVTLAVFATVIATLFSTTG